MCGTAIGRACPHCGFANPSQFRFCGLCGGVLDGAQKTESPAPATLAAQPAPPEPALAVLAPESPEKPLPDGPLNESERRIISVVIADVAGSTSLLEEIGNEAWVDLMSRILSALESEIYRFGGVVDQFRGDGLVAFFGAQKASEDDPERAVLAGLLMQKKMAEFDREVAGKSTRGVKLRVGVSTGEVIVGGVGDATQHREDTAMGIAITVAARMESSAAPGTVMVSDYTYRQVVSQFDWQALGELTVKGLSQPLAVYRPLEFNSNIERLSDHEVFGYSVDYIGRDQEFKQMRFKSEELLLGRGGIILLSGETGVGKNGLIRQLRQHVLRKDSILSEMLGLDGSGMKPTLWLISRSRTYDWNWPYSLWTELLSNWLMHCAGQHCDDPQESLRQETLRLWGDEMGEYYPYLATMMEMPLEEPHLAKVKYLDGEALRFQFQAAVRAWLEKLVKAQPVVVVSTGMEWTDPSSIELINYCLPLIEEAPLLWLFSYRPERSADVWNLRRTIEISYQQYLLSIDLEPLSDKECDRLVQSLVGTDTLSKETRSLLVKNSGGMPAYIIEIFRSLIENGILQQEGPEGRWHLTRAITTLDMPANMLRLLQARFDRMGDEQRYVLQLAAVVGPVFWTSVLQGMTGASLPLRESLDALLQDRVIERTGRVTEMGTEYAFKSNLFREAAYDSLLSSHRDWYHLRAAMVLEEVCDLQQRDSQAIIAYHFRRGGDLRKELFYTFWAAENAHEFFASAEALEHYTRVLELLDALEVEVESAFERKQLLTTRFEVLSGRYIEYYLLGDVDAGGQDARMLLEIARAEPDEPVWMIDALLRQPETAQMDQKKHIEPGLRMADEALNLARQIGDRHRQLGALMIKAALLAAQGASSAEYFAKEALGLARELGDARHEVSLLLGLAETYGLEDVRLSAEYLDRAVEITKRIADKAIEINLLAVQSMEVERVGDYHRLLFDYESKRLELCREIGDKLNEGFVLSSLAQAKGLYLGDYQAALVDVRRAFRLTRKLASSLYPLLRTIQLHAMMGNFEQAQKNLDLAYPLADKATFDLGRGAVRLNDAILCTLRGGEADCRKALELVDFAVGLVYQAKMSRQYHMAGCCIATTAHLALAMMLSDEAERKLHRELALRDVQTALDIYQGYGFVQIIECFSEEVHFRHGQALAVNGQHDAARQAFERAYAEMMRKYELIPAASPYRQTYLENIVLHRQIREAQREA